MWILIYILFLHWWADFICQPRWIVENKTKDYRVLLVHVLVYGLILAIGLGGVLPRQQLLPFLAVVVSLHAVVDAATSKLIDYLRRQQWTQMFFTALGFDFFIHTACLVATAKWLIGGV